MTLIKDMTKKELGLDSLEKAYNQALQDVLASLPEEKIDITGMTAHKVGFNDCLEEVKSRLEGLRK